MMFSTSFYSRKKGLVSYVNNIRIKKIECTALDFYKRNLWTIRGFALAQNPYLPRLSAYYPIEPSISNLIRRFISTAYSIGNSFVNGSMKPITIISVASSSEIPRDIK